MRAVIVKSVVVQKSARMLDQSLPLNGDGAKVKSEGSQPQVKNDVDYELPELPEAPVFYPTAEEFADPMKYLDSIREQATPAGVIKIVPPKEWRCPFPIKENGDSFHFQTCVQSVDQLRHRHGPGTKFMQRLRHFHRTRGLHLPAEVPPAASHLRVAGVFGPAVCFDA